MKSQRKYTSSEIKEIEEKFIIDCYCEYCRDVVLDEYPIQLIQQNQLKPGASIPDGILKELGTGQKRWIEVTSSSRFSNDRKKIGLKRKGLLNEVGRMNGPINLNVGERSLKEEVSKALWQKSKKRYEEFSRLANLREQGTLVIYIDMLDPFLDANEWYQICEYFRDKMVLYFLGLGGSSFSEVFLLSNVRLSNGEWAPKLSLVAGGNMMSSLKELEKLQRSVLTQYGL